MVGITFIRNLIHGDVESPELLRRLHFNVCDSIETIFL